MDDNEGGGLVEFTFGDYLVLQPGLAAWKRLFKSISSEDLDVVQELWEKRGELLAGDVRTFKVLLPLLARLPDIAQEVLVSCLHGPDGEALEVAKAETAVPADLLLLFKAIRDQGTFDSLLDVLGNLPSPEGKVAGA